MQLNKLTGLILLCFALFSSGLVAQENKFSLSSYGDELSSDPDKFLYFNNLDGVLFLTGTIEKGMYTNFRQAITENKIHTIVLNSMGGDVDEGLNIAGTVFDKGIKTYIPEGYRCYSACSFIFFAGYEKYALGELGVHQAAYADDISKEKAAIGAVTTVSQLTTADILLRLGEFNTPRFVEQRMLRTAPGDMYIFNETELNKLGNLDVSNNNKSLFINIDKFIADLQSHYAEQDCDNDVKKCTSSQLCQRAAADKSWNKATNATKYVIAAKGKGLTCGVPAPVCPEDIKKCNEEYLCTYGTTGLDANLSWLNNSFADEAKLRDLSCNVKDIKTSVKKPNTTQVVNGSLSGTWDVLYSLCSGQRYKAVLKLSQDTRINKNEYYATYNAPHGYYTGTAQDNNGNFVINLDRGLIANGFIYQNYNRAQGKDQNGCLFEAKKRLKKSYVKTDKVNSCVLDIKKCTTRQLCARGTRIVNSNFLWQTNKNFEKYVSEAKRRGLTCGVKKKAPIINEMVRSIQKQLNRLGCNAGTADGILGRKTLSALKRWKSAGGNYTTNKIDQRLRSSLFESIYKCSSAQTSSTSKFTGDIRVAALAGNWVVKPNKDFSCKFNGSTIIINRRGLIQTVSGQAVEGTIYPGWNNKSLFINLVIVGKKRIYEGITVDQNSNSFFTNGPRFCYVFVRKSK